MGGEWFFYSPQSYDRANFLLPNVSHRVAGVPSFLRASQMGQLFFPRWAKRDDVDVFWSPRHQLPLLLSADIRSVVTIHDLVWKRFGETMRFPGRQLEAFLMPRSVAMAEEVVAVSEFTKTELIACFPLSKGKISVVAGASHITDTVVSTDRVEPGYFLFVGTMEPRKNLPKLLRAYARYLELSDKPHTLKLVGGRGWGIDESEGVANRPGLHGKVEVLGKVDEKTLYSLYTAAHALVMPSLYEGFGLPIVESLSRGVPVITSRGSAMSEVAGDAGILVDPHSEEDICRALLAMTTDRALYNTLRARASGRSQQYSWAASASQMFELLTSKAATERSPAPN
jgi:glycosyltransferase involved in cell wall biosynthesis